MYKPEQSPPVERVLHAPAPGRSLAASTHAIHPALEGANCGVSASGYEDCFKLQGLAQQLCLEYY